METLTINRDDDTQLTVYRWPAHGTPCGIVLIVHGMAEHGRRYAGLAAQLVAAGLDVYTFDLRGHGASSLWIDHGYVSTDTRWQTLIDDVEAVRALARKHTGTRPVILFGHSLGCFIAQATAQLHGRAYAAMVLSAPANPGRIMCRLGAIVARIEAIRIGSTGRSAILRAMTFGGYSKATKKRLGQQRTQFDWLSSRPDQVDAYVRDPQTGFDLRTSYWRCLLPGIARTQSPHTRRRTPAHLPLFIGAGTDDPVGRFGRDPRALAGSYVNNGQTDVTLQLYDGARHEIINDFTADDFTHDMLHWLAEREFIHPTGSSSPCDD